MQFTVNVLTTSIGFVVFCRHHTPLYRLIPVHSVIVSEQTVAVVAELQIDTHHEAGCVKLTRVRPSLTLIAACGGNN